MAEEMEIDDSLYRYREIQQILIYYNVVASVICSETVQ